MCPSPQERPPDRETLEGLGARLETFAEGLSVRERAALLTIVVRALDPVDRMRLRDPDQLLDQKEAAYLRRLEAEG